MGFGSIFRPAPTVEQFIEQVKNSLYAYADLKSAGAGLNNMWSDTFKDASQIDAANSRDYTHRGASDYDVIKDTIGKTKLLVHSNPINNGTVFKDSGPTGHAITRNNTPKTSTAEKKFGFSSGLFTFADTDYLSVADHADFDLSATDFTIEAWVYLPALSAFYGVFSHATDSGNSFQWGINSSGDLYVRLRAAGANVFIMQSSSAPISINTWHHICIQKTNGGGYEGFVDGVSVCTHANTTAPADYTGTVRVGENYLAAHEPFNGYMDGFRISTVKRYSDGGFTAPSAAFSSDANTSLLIHFDGDGQTGFEDASPTGHTVTANGNAQISAQEKKLGDGSAFMDGTGDYLSIAAHADFDLDSNDFTLEGFIKISTGSKLQFFINLQIDANNYITLGIDASNYAKADIVVSSTTEIDITGTTDLDDGAWHHIALIRTGNTFKLFVDGTQEGGDDTYAGAVTSTNPTVYISSHAGATEIFDGWIDEVRIVNGEAKYTDTFVPTSSEFGDGIPTDAIVRTATITFADDVTEIMAFVDMTLNAGALSQVRISTDAGSNWQDITNNLEEIVTVPAGKQVVLEATFTADAELEFMAVAGNA